MYLAALDAYLSDRDHPGEDLVRFYMHGLGSAASVAFPRIVRDPRLARYRALLVDLLGYGFSDRPTAFPHTLTAQAQAIAR